MKNSSGQTTRLKATEAITPFNYSGVELKESMFKDQFEQMKQYYLAISNDDILKAITYNADTFDVQVDAMRRARDRGVETVIARFDPIIPTVTDSKDDLEFMFDEVATAGATHVIMSSMDIPSIRKADFREFLGNIGDIDEIMKIYDKNGQMVGRDLNATMEYRRDLFGLGKKLANERGITFSLCMEFEVIGKGSEKRFRGLNEDYMTSPACEKVEIPIYYRKDLGNKFEPLSLTTNCNGNCLYHFLSGIEDLRKQTWRTLSTRRKNHSEHP